MYRQKSDYIETQIYKLLCGNNYEPLQTNGKFYFNIPRLSFFPKRIRHVWAVRKSFINAKAQDFTTECRHDLQTVSFVIKWHNDIASRRKTAQKGIWNVWSQFLITSRSHLYSGFRLWSQSDKQTVCRWNEFKPVWQQTTHAMTGKDHGSAFWVHDERISALLAICAGKSPVTGEFPAQRPVTRSFNFFLICAWIHGWVNNCEAGGLRRHHAHYDVIVMYRLAWNELIWDLECVHFQISQLNIWNNRHDLLSHNNDLRYRNYDLPFVITTDVFRSHYLLTRNNDLRVSQLQHSLLVIMTSIERFWNSMITVTSSCRGSQGAVTSSIVA